MKGRNQENFPKVGFFHEKNHCRILIIRYTVSMARHTLKRQILLLTTTVMVLVSALVFLFAYQQYRQYSRASQRSSAEYNIRIIGTVAEGELRSVRELCRWAQFDSDVDAWLANPEDTGLLLTAHEALFSEFIRNPASAYISRFVIIDPQRRALLQVGSDVSVSKPLTIYTIGNLFSFSDDERFQPLIDDPLLPPLSPQMIPLCAPLSSWNDSSVKGYLCVEVSTRILTDKLPEPASPLAIEVDGSFWQWDGKRFLPFAPEAKWRNRGVSWPMEEGMVLFQYLPSLSLHAERGFLLMFLGVLLVLLCIGFLLAWWLNRMVGLPVIRIRSHLRRIAEGDFRRDASIEYDSEIGDIGRGINELAEKIEALIQARIQDEADRKDLEYRMLQNQINPHFLNNTLNSIKCMADLKHADGISQMVTALARLLQHVSKGSKSWCAIREELALLADYEVIQSYRYGGSIELKQEVPEEFMDVAIPRFTFQPVVENAIFHGIEPKGGGTITVSARAVGEDDVCFVIHDDGVGMTELQVKELLSKPQENASGMFKSIGMYNVHQRIVRMFGPRYGLRVESEIGKGTSVEVLLPKRGKVDGTL